MSRCMTDTDNLTAVADAIRTKGGTSAHAGNTRIYIVRSWSIRQGSFPRFRQFRPASRRSWS